MSSPAIEEATTDQQILACHEALTEQLNPHRRDAEDFLRRVRRQQQLFGYHLMFISDGQKPVSVLGYMLREHLWAGKVFYVDDLATLRCARRRGHADRLFEWAIDKAKELDCDQLTLESPFGFTDAHRFYLNHKMSITSMHFQLDLK